MITISRQFGSMGRSIARELSEILGIEFLDRDIVEATAKRMGLPVSVISDEEESMKSTFFRRQYPLGMGMSSLKDEIFLTQKNIIRDFAAKGSCIIVGRCADYILREHPRCANVFISASKEDRIARLCAMHHIDAEAAEVMIEKADKRRSEYYNYYSYKTWGAAATYHLCVDSSSLGVEETVRFIEEFVVKKLQLIL